MPPKSKKEGKGSKDQPKEMTDDELKQSKAFNKIFKEEVLKNAQDANERSTIEGAYSNTQSHDEFTFFLFDLEWFLIKYEDIFNSAKIAFKAASAKKEEPPVVKNENKMEEEFSSQRLWGNYTDPQHPQFYPNNYQGHAYNQMGQNPATRQPSYPGIDVYNYSQDPSSHMYRMQGQAPITPSTMTGQYPVAGQSAYPTATPGYPQQGQSVFPQQPQGAYPQATQAAYPQMTPQMMAQPQIATQASPYMATNLQSPAHIQQVQAQPQAQPVNIQPQPQATHQQPPTLQPQPATPQQPVKTVPEKAEKAAALREQQYQTTTEFENNPNSQIGQDLNSVVPLNYNVMFNVFHKNNKKATDGFYNALYLSVADYVNNLLDELRNVCEMDNDATDLKQYMKIGGSGHEAENDARSVLVGTEEGGEKKMTKHSQYLVKFSSVQEDQKQIEKIDDKEQKDLEERYTLSKEDEEDKDKPTKKLKKDVTEEDEIIKFLFKTKKEKGQDNENTYKKTLEINQTLSNLTSRTYSAPKTAHMHDSSAQGANTGKGRKSTASQKRVTMKHMIYYLETNPMYKRTPLLHKAYLK